MVIRGFSAAAGAVVCMACAAWGADPWADRVVSYVAGEGVSAGYDSPGSALGEPTRYTGVGVYPGAVTPFNSAYLGGEIVTLGRGGVLVVAFDEPVADDPLNPFGIDLLIFGNSFYSDANYPNGVAGTLFAEGGGVEVSADGSEWRRVPVLADGLFPTLGYLDLTDPYATLPGSVPSDFTRSVDPAFDPGGLAFARIVAGYAGSGGGAGIDLAATGLASISFVRISNAGGMTPDIDALSDAAPVPGPGAGLLLIAAGARRRRL